MALTDDQKHQVVFHLGYSGKTIIAGTTDYNKTVVDALGGLNSYVEAQVVDLLDQIATAKEKFSASSSRMLVKKVGDIELNTDEHRSLGQEFRRLIRELSSLLGIPAQGLGGISIGVVL